MRVATESELSDAVPAASPAKYRADSHGGAGHDVDVKGITDAELVDLVRSAQIACVPSLYEGFSLPAAEAMATGTPLVATTGGAIPEVAGPTARPVWPCRPATPARWPRRWSGCSATRSCARRLGAAGRERVLARFTWKQAATAPPSCYRAGDRAPAPPPTQPVQPPVRPHRPPLALAPAPPPRPTAKADPRADRRLLPLPARRRRPRARPGLRRRPARLRVLPARRPGRGARPERRGDPRGRQVVRRDEGGRRGPGGCHRHRHGGRRAQPALPRRRPSTSSSSPR